MSTDKNAAMSWWYLDLDVNFVTPTPIEYGYIGNNYVYEIAKGSWMGTPVVGLSVRKRGMKVRGPDDHDEFGQAWSATFQSVEEAQRHVVKARLEYSRQQS